MGENVSEAKVSRIVATSRASIKVKDSYYTMEYQEERLIPDSPAVDIEQERAMLWNTVNAEVDNQIEELINTINGR